MRIALLGKGMLGWEFAELAAAAGHELSVWNFPEFDIRDEAQLKRACQSADAIVNCAAYTAVDKAEAEPELCRQINALPLAVIGQEARRSGAHVVHISTDFVFDGSGERPWREEDEPAPLNVYGATKLEGERLLAESGCRHATMRVQWTYGAHGANFASKIAELARTRNSLKIVDDQIGAPTHAAEMAKAMLALLGKRVEGLFHFAASGYASRYETAQLIFKTLGIGKELLPCKSSEFPTPAARPLNSRFDCSKIERAIGIERPAWQETLARFLKPS